MIAEQRRKDMKPSSAFFFFFRVLHLRFKRTPDRGTVSTATICFSRFSLPQYNTSGNSNKLCISFNLAETSVEKLWCELLPSNIYNNTGKIVLNFKFDHCSIQVSSKPKIIDVA